MTPRHLYLAGPDVFAPDAHERGLALKALCTAAGAVGVYPLDTETRLPVPAATIRQRCLDAIRGCDIVVANLTPFRGPSLDPGTAYELGFAAALGKPVVGYTADERDYSRRVAALPGSDRDADGVLRDSHGMAVEDFGIALIDNLMIACGLEALFGGAEEAIGHAVRMAL